MANIEDLQELVDLKDGEIYELNLEIASKDEKISKYSKYITKLKHENELNKVKLDSEVKNDKAKIKELDDLNKKIEEKDLILADKQDQVNYQRELIDDFRAQIKETTENLEIQLRKISNSYENLLKQKDLIIEKQDEIINNLNKSVEDITKANKINYKSLELQNNKYEKIIDDLTK